MLLYKRLLDKFENAGDKMCEELLLCGKLYALISINALLACGIFSLKYTELSHIHYYATWFGVIALSLAQFTLLYKGILSLFDVIFFFQNFSSMIKAPFYLLKAMLYIVLFLHIFVFVNLVLPSAVVVLLTCYIADISYQELNSSHIVLSLVSHLIIHGLFVISYFRELNRYNKALSDLKNSFYRNKFERTLNSSYDFLLNINFSVNSVRDNIAAIPESNPREEIKVDASEPVKKETNKYVKDIYLLKGQKLPKPIPVEVLLGGLTVKSGKPMNKLIFFWIVSRWRGISSKKTALNQTLEKKKKPNIIKNKTLTGTGITTGSSRVSFTMSGDMFASWQDIKIAIKRLEKTGWFNANPAKYQQYYELWTDFLNDNPEVQTQLD